MIRDLFDQEVTYLWSWLARAAHGRDELGSLWSRDGDPRVRRLVQAAAHAFARVREPLEDDVPAISHALVADALPEVLRSTPSATVIQAQDPRRALKTLSRYEPGIALQSRAIADVPCLFRTSWPLVAAPVALTQAAIHTRERGVQVLTLRLEAYCGGLLRFALPDDLRIFIEARDPSHALDIVHALCSSQAAPRLRALDGRGMELSARECGALRPRWTALTETFALTAGPSDRFPSGSSLRTFFAFPEAFAFFELPGLDAATADLPEATHALELTIPLRGTVPPRAGEATYHLGCSPALNVFATELAPIATRGLGACGRLLVPGHPDRELLHIADVRLVSDRAPDATVPVRLWETFRSRPYLDDELFLRVVRRAALGHGPTELHATLLRPSGEASGMKGSLRIRGLATDGCRTESLLRGDVTSISDSVQLRNISRVSVPQRAALGAHLAWRANAYARMPVASFSAARSLAAYLDIHDVTGRRHSILPGAQPSVGGVVSATRAPVKLVDGDEVLSGDQIDLQLDETILGGAGATWLVGELLARAIVERADFLRFTRTRLVHENGSVRADYGIRRGRRLPPPFG